MAQFGLFPFSMYNSRRLMKYNNICPEYVRSQRIAVRVNRSWMKLQS